MQLRNAGVGVVACSPNEPQKPVKPLGSVAGSFSSPRLAMKIRVGLSANTPPVEPQMYPGLASASGCGQLGTTSYGPVRSSPPFSCSGAADAVSLGNAARRVVIAARIFRTPYVACQARACHVPGTCLAPCGSEMLER